jgi:hypothetical protein
MRRSPLLSKSPRELRFWAYVNKTDTCWLWAGPTFRSSGYGRFNINREHLAAHRVAWELTNGPIPAGLFACHHCDVRQCVRPDHLFLGTQADNVRDMFVKGRNPSFAGPLNGRSHARRRLVQGVQP